MSETSKALRATSDSLLRDLAELHELEQRKRVLDPGDDRLVLLAEEIEVLAVRVLGASIRQRQITQQAEAQIDAGAATAPETSIADTPREIHVILAEWREAERERAETPDGSPRAQELEQRVDALRDEYRRAHEAVERRRPGGGGR